MKKILVLLISSMIIAGCSSTKKVESTPTPSIGMTTPRLEKETIKNIINNIEEKGDFLDCSFEMGIVMGYGGTFTFAFNEDDIFYFFNQEIMVLPDEEYFVTKNAKCVYDYNNGNASKNTECTNEDIELGGKVLDFMENKLSEFDTDINSIKEVVIYVRDNKYSTSFHQENETEVNKDIQTNATIGEQNALKKALSYLNSSSFSYSGLIDQLEYSGFTLEESTYAVDNCGANWEEQALDKALSYLNSSAFSYTGLIDQLEYSGFTTEQAIYGADNCNADWNEQAANKAQSYLDSSSFSRKGLIDQLEYSGFTTEQAEYGVTAVGY